MQGVGPIWIMDPMQSNGRHQDPMRILRELSSVVTDIVAAGGPVSAAEGLVDWCSSLRDDPPAAKLLAKFARLGADLERLLLVGLRFRTSRAEYERALARLSFCRAPLAERITLPTNGLLPYLEGQEDPGDIPLELPPIEVLRDIDRRLEKMNDQIRKARGEPREVWRSDDDGELRKVAFTPDENGAFAWCFPLKLTPEHAPVPHERKGAGHPMDIAEAVLVVLVAAHLNAVTGRPHLNLAGQFVSRVLQIPAPRCGEFSDHARAFENRARRHWQRAGISRRAKLLAEEFGIPIRFA